MMPTSSTMIAAVSRPTSSRMRRHDGSIVNTQASVSV
jgi:hypothetical protein